MVMKPLNLESIIANSIARYVLAHPELTDTVQAYNAWVVDEAKACNYPMDHKMTMFALEQFDCDLHLQTRERLREMLEIEDEYQIEYNRMMVASF